VSNRRNYLDTTAFDGIVKEVNDAHDPVDNGNPRNARKVESETPEARFFLKDKLCAIGLADVSILPNCKPLTCHSTNLSAPMTCQRL